MAVIGQNLFIKVNGYMMAGARVSDFQSSCETISKSTPLTSNYKEFVVGRRTWKMTVNYLLLAEANVRTVLNLGTVFELVLVGRNSTDSQGVSGRGIMTECKITSTLGNIVQGTFVFTGTGPLS